MRARTPFSPSPHIKGDDTIERAKPHGRYVGIVPTSFFLVLIYITSRFTRIYFYGYLPNSLSFFNVVDY